MVGLFAMNVALLEPMFQQIERRRESFFPPGLSRFAYFAGHVNGYYHALECSVSSLEGVTRPRFSLFVCRHFNRLHNEHRWGAGRGVWSVLRAEFSDDDEAVDAFISLARDYWARHSGQTLPDGATPRFDTPV